MNRRDLLRLGALTAVAPHAMAAAPAPLNTRVLRCEGKCGKTILWPLPRAWQPRRWMCTRCWSAAVGAYDDVISGPM